MRVNDEGIALICEFEGCRTEAYLDCAGVWTIGYGHTCKAGPPEVVRGMQIDKDQARSILTRDLAEFSAGVGAAIRALLNDNQFSALVSFAYNVGLGNFRKSSVLTAVNSGDLEAVPRRLALWVKAGGKIMPGLVLRRAAEAALFLQPEQAESTTASGAQTNQQLNNTAAAPADQGPQTAEHGEPIEPILSERFQQSRTTVAALLSGASGVVSATARRMEEWLGSHISLLVEIAAASVIVLAAAWIICERQRIAREEGI
jgi:lysozyme